MTQFLIVASPNHHADQRFKGALFLTELMLWTRQLSHELNVFFLALFFNMHSTFSYESLQAWSSLLTRVQVPGTLFIAALMEKHNDWACVAKIRH